MISSQEYQIIRIKGIEATQHVHGSDRGGYVLQGRFYFPAATNIGILDVEAKDWTPSVDVNSGNGEFGW